MVDYKLSTLYDDPLIKISIIENGYDKSILCFTGVGHALNGIDVQSEEFLKATCQATTIFIIDKERSFGNNINFSLMKCIIFPYIQGKVLYTLGNSMGGFLAILATKFFNIDVSISFVPQYSVSKNIFPHENRWDAYVNNISFFKFESLDNAFNEQTTYYIFGGIGGPDDKHLYKFPRRENVHTILIKSPAYHHQVAKKFKQDGQLYNVINDCMHKMPPEAIIAKSLLNIKDIISLPFRKIEGASFRE